MGNWLRTAFTIIRETFQEYGQDKAPRLAAALAYHTAFSLAPLLIVAIAIAGVALGQEAVQARLTAEIQSMLGPEAAVAVEEILANASRPGAGLVATAIGIVTLLFGALGFFAQLQDALNTVWGLEPKPGQSIIAVIRSRVISFAMVLGVGFLLLVSLVLSAFVGAASGWLGERIALPDGILQGLNFVIGFVVTTLLFAMIYKVLPDARIRWRDVAIGALITSLLFTIGRLLIGLYLGNSAVSSAYGAAGSFVVLLLWIFYSSQILLLGAEFTQVYARHLGKRIVPNANARFMSPGKRAEQGLAPQTEKAGNAALRPESRARAAADTMVATALAKQQSAVIADAARASRRIDTAILTVIAALGALLVGLLLRANEPANKPPRAE
jgi:membrane protein